MNPWDGLDYKIINTPNFTNKGETPMDSSILVAMNPRTIQSLIQFNKVQIRELGTQRKYLQHLIQLFWNSCIPTDPYGILSNTAFNCLNRSKESLVEVNKKLKLLAELQYALKSSIR